MKKYSKFIFIFAVCFLLLIVVEFSRPKEIDWSYSFSKSDKIPYGCFITYKILPDLFPGSEISTADYPVYNTLNEEDIDYYTYVFINDKFSPDELDSEALLNFVSKGNIVFIAANSFSGICFDSLKVTTGLSYLNSGSSEINFTNHKLNNGPYKVKNAQMDYYFSSFDTLNTVVLGINEDKRPNYIKINYGEGNIYLNTVPLAFTNYNILKPENSDYIYKSLSYLPEDYSVYWDEYYKSNKALIRTPLRYVLNQEALSWAYYLLIFSIVLYIIFFGRRKQRIIPVIKPLANTTLEFVKTIGRLYFQQRNHKNIADKKINYFLDQVRNHYYVKTDEINSETLERISNKSGLALSNVKEVFSYIKYINSRVKISEAELNRISYLIESFYKRAGIHGGTI